MPETLQRRRSQPRQRRSTNRNSPTWQHCFHSKLGWIAWQGTERGVTQLTLGQPSRDSALAALPEFEGKSQLPDWFDLAHRKLADYCNGAERDLSGIPLDLQYSTPFAESVVRSLLNVSYGETVSYLELAEMAGSPRAARAVGTVMSKNTVPLIVPCHRVIGSGGRLGGYSAPQGLTMKQLLLEMEQNGTGR